MWTRTSAASSTSRTSCLTGNGRGAEQSASVTRRAGAVVCRCDARVCLGVRVACRCAARVCGGEETHMLPAKAPGLTVLDADIISDIWHRHWSMFPI
eukprot:5815112-Pyramimonas_sp.AAC.1